MSAISHRRYTLRSRMGEGWAIIVIGSDGYFSVVSDYGNYAFIWTARGRGPAGEDFRTFLRGIGPDYLACKLKPEQVYDAEATEKAVKGRIKELRRQELITKDDAREAWDSFGAGDAYELRDWTESSTISEHLDIHELMSFSLGGDITNFCKVILPRFKEVLKRDQTEYPTFEDGCVEE